MIKPPWKIVYNTDYWHDVDPEDLAQRYIVRIEDAEGNTVSYTEDGFFRMPQDVAELIVQAPKLKEQLEEVDQVLTEMGWHTDRGLLQRVRQTLGKE